MVDLKQVETLMNCGNISLLNKNPCKELLFTEFTILLVEAAYFIFGYFSNIR